MRKDVQERFAEARGSGNWAQCPECKQISRCREYSHTAECSHATVTDLRFWCKFYRSQTQTAFARARQFVTESQRWEGKHRIVCHENNQLRKKIAKITP